MPLSPLEDFVAYGSWFDRYEPLLGPRYPTFKAAIGLFLQAGGQRIVETGSMRPPGQNWTGDGNSSLLFAEVAFRYQRAFWTVDIDNEATNTTYKHTYPYLDRVVYVTSSSVPWLWDKAPSPIDLLYLDSLDCPEAGDATKAQQHQDSELQAAWSKLAPTAVVLLDDNWFSNGGKTRLAKQRLHKEGWRCVLDHQQSLWMP